MKTILLSVKTFPPNFTGAGLRAFRLSGRMYQKYGFHFRALCTEPSDEEDINNEYLTVKRMSSSLDNLLLRPISMLITSVNIYRYLNKHKNDIETIHFFSFGIINRIIMAVNVIAFKKKTILEITQDGDDDPISLIQKGIKNKLLKKWTLHLLKRIDRFTVLSKFSYDSCLKVGIDNSKIWHRPNPIDETIFGSIAFKEKSAIRTKLGIPDKFVLLNVGLIQPRKNQLFLCECIKYLNNDNALLLLIGPTKPDFMFYEDEINEYLSDNGLRGKVKLLGNKENINEYMIAADSLVFASKNEGFCNVLAESTMSGLPIISLYSDGYYPYVTSETGVMLNERETESSDVIERFTEEVRLMMNQYGEVDREVIRQYAKEKFSAKKIDEGYKSLYDGLNA